MTWQLDPAGFAGEPPPTRAFIGDGGAVAIIEVTERTVVVLALAVPAEHRRAHAASRLVAALLARFPGRPGVVPAYVPADLAADYFARTAWSQTPIEQVEMVATPGR